MKNCLQISLRTAASLLVLAGSLSIAQAQTADKAPAASGDAPKYVLTASGEKIPLTSGVEKHVGIVTVLDRPTIIDNRVDSNAILNLESKPLTAPAADAPAADAPAASTSVTPAAVSTGDTKSAAKGSTSVVAGPKTAQSLAAQLKDAKARYADAKAALTDAQKANNQTATVTARRDVADAQSDIDRINREIAATHRKKSAR